MSEKTIAEKLTDIANNIPIIRQKAYAEGYNNGLSASDNEYYEAGVEAGKQAEYDRFWDEFQQNGNRRNYTAAFRTCWTDETFKPKYDIIGGARTMQQTFQSTGIKDLKGICERQGIIIDTSACETLLQLFQSAAVTIVPTLDVGKCTSLSLTFSTENIVTIEKLIVSENTVFLDTTFEKGLENIVFEGVIGNDIYFNKCNKLTHESLMSIINHLKDFSGTGTTKTLTLGTTNQEKLTEDEKNIARGKGWTLA